MANLHPKVKLWLANGDEGFFGPGTLRLLKLTLEMQSLKAACARMELSYSKGWKIIANMERELGYSVLIRQQGGRNGGGCDLTPKGKVIMERYELFTERAVELVGTAFDEIFDGA
jgi:molybdate transport repressor ModE-like protein